MSNRFALFDSPPAEGWVPAIGSTVALKKRKGTMGRIVSKGTVIGHTLVPEVVVVRVSFGRRVLVQRWLVSDLRPIERRICRQ